MAARRQAGGVADTKTTLERARRARERMVGVYIFAAGWIFKSLMGI